MGDPLKGIFLDQRQQMCSRMMDFRLALETIYKIFYLGDLYDALLDSPIFLREGSSFVCV